MQEAEETWVLYLGREDPLEEGMATHSSILAWRIPQTEEPGRLQSIGSQRDTTKAIDQARKRHLGSSSSLSDKCRAVDTCPLIFSGLLNTLYFSVECVLSHFSCA